MSPPNLGYTTDQLRPLTATSVSCSSDINVEPEPTDPPSMFIRQEGRSARQVRPTARLREAHPDLFDGLPPPPVLRRPRGRPPKGRRGRPPDRRRPSPPPDLSDPEVRARLVQQALDEYDWRQARDLGTDLVHDPDGTQTLYINMPSGDEEEGDGGAGVTVRRRGRPRGSTSVRSRRARGVKRRRGGHSVGGDRSGLLGAPPDEEEEETPLAERLPPNTTQRFREVLAHQRAVQVLMKQLEDTPAPPVELGLPGGVSEGAELGTPGDGTAGGADSTEDSSLMVLRGGEPLPAEPLPPEGDNYSTPTTLEVALGLLHQQRLENLRLRAGLLRATIRERQCSLQLVEARQQAAEANRMFQDKLGDMFTPAQMKLIQNRSMRRTHMWDTVDIKRAIGLRRLCTRRAYAYVKDVLRVPLPGLAVLRGSSQRNPETALMYTEMVDHHRLKHMTKRKQVTRPARVTVTPASMNQHPATTTVATEPDNHVDQKYIVLTTENDRETGEIREGHVMTDPAEANELLQSVHAAQAAGQTVIVDASGAPLLVDRASGESPPPEEEHFLMLVPEDEEEEVLEAEDVKIEPAPARSPPYRPGILRAPGETREREQAAARAGTAGTAAGVRPRFKLVVKGDGEVLTEDGRPLEEISWPAGLQWMDTAQVNFE